MEHDDVLEDLLSWTGDSSSNTVTRRPRKRPSLQEGCVNTSSTTTTTTMAAKAEKPRNTLFSSPPHGSVRSMEEEVGNKTVTAHPSANAFSAVATKDEFVLPNAVNARLLPHQRDGVRWLYRRHCKSRACLLADEMGLGKTVQVAAFLGELYQRKQIKTSILIVPPTLVPMWEAALVEWGGSEMQKLVEVIHNDPRKKRQARWRKLKYGLPCVLLTTYGVLRQDATDMSATLVDYLVLDEAHLIKDANTCVFKSALTLSARHKIALSGTPLMNSFEDMWSLFRFLDGSILTLSKADFNTVSTTLLRGNEKDATMGQREAASLELAKLQAAIRPFMLRREKKDLVSAVTSAKQDVVVWVRLSEVQQRQYEAFLESKSASTKPNGSSVGSSGGGSYMDVDNDGTNDNSSTSSETNTNPLLLLTMLSQICNHPWLNFVDAAFNAAVAQPYAAPLPEMGDIFAGAKLWVALQLLIHCIRAGRKCLVFSRSKRLLRLLSVLLKDWWVPHVQVDGDTASDQRFAAVSRFNEGDDVWVCLLTTQVGGVGLTFTAASAVVLLDPSWNPSADAQAVDRVHRIGQVNDVTVYRLVTCGTVEEKVYRNQIFKRMAALQSVRVNGGVSHNGGDPDEEEDSGKGATPSTPTDGQDTEDASSELYRYFTRLQLRSMFVMDDVDRSSTAEQLELLHPRRIDSGTRRYVCRIDGVCDVSDNGCVLTERVDQCAAEATGVVIEGQNEPNGMVSVNTVFHGHGERVGRETESLLTSVQRVRARSESALSSLSSSTLSTAQRQRVEDVKVNPDCDFTIRHNYTGINSVTKERNAGPEDNTEMREAHLPESALLKTITAVPQPLSVPEGVHASLFVSNVLDEADATGEFSLPPQRPLVGCPKSTAAEAHCVTDAVMNLHTNDEGASPLRLSLSSQHTQLLDVSTDYVSPTAGESHNNNYTGATLHVPSPPVSAFSVELQRREQRQCEIEHRVVNEFGSDRRTPLQAEVSVGRVGRDAEGSVSSAEFASCRSSF